MRRFALAPVLIAPFVLLPLSAQHRTSPATTTPAPHTTDLPVTSVSLYKNGVGFFEHTGHITGDATVTIDFTTSQLNDVLQSLTAIDLNGGRISGAGYNSTTPLEQQLKSLPLALGEDPAAVDFYSAIRGARLEVHSGTASITGRLLSVENRAAPAKLGDDSQPGISHYFLTVVSDIGEVRTIELNATTSVRLLDADLHTSVNRYLQLLAGNRSQGLRHLALEDRGTGTRELRVSYISEVPIWKSTYRLLLTSPADHTAPKTATLQGWAVVDNTVGSDWVNVKLSLVAGSPQSFIQPLSDPIYSRRPEIPIAQEAQLTPQTHDSSMDENKATDKLDRFSKLASPALVSSGVALGAGYGAGSAGGVMGGMAGGSGSGPAMAMAPPAPVYEEAAAESIAPNTKTAGFDDFFQYKLNEPVTIRKNESAMVPILQVKLPIENVTLVTSNAVAVSQPLRAMWITNDSGLTLDRGSFSIVENGNFGGEGLMDPVHPGERRLLSYAADQSVQVAIDKTEAGMHMTQLTAAKGVIILHHTYTSNMVYAIHNASSEPRTVILEHPIRSMFVLDSDIKPDEKTATEERFRIVVAPGATERLPVNEHHRSVITYRLTNSNDAQLATILSQTKDNPAAVAALQPILDARRRIADAQTAVNQTNARLKNLREEEERQRANITALNNADKGSRDRFVHDLNTTEDEIKSTEAEFTSRTAALDAAKADLSNRIEALQIDQKL